ncbi:MAG TPA: glycine cleavage system aminomethyltransferase GcvT [Solirubrobacteraceae bacterium]|jgi:aminomethyltransferase|nr:glycine cleavage system aminomethyltransferase GcvT [Solirubrobacteraceae bacterium]
MIEHADAGTPLRRTALHERHVQAGARMVPFAGWQMPVQYPAGIRAEHMAVRQSAGIFDVSHMGEIEAAGPGAGALMQRLLSEDVGALAVGEAGYGVMCREDGGVLDDLITCRLREDRYLTVTNAANHERDLAWVREHAAGYDVEVQDAIDRYAMLAVQGPLAREIVQAGADHPLPGRFEVAAVRLGAASVLVCGTGYTGEDGVELLCAPEDAPALWDDVVRRGAQPAGLGARDTLRLEACLHLYGNDLDQEHGPIEAGLGWCCKEDTGFIGVEAVRAARAAGPARRLVPFLMSEPGIARAGCPVVGGGVVTSGTLSPVLNRGIGMAYLPAQAAKPGTPFEIDVRGRVRPALVARRPLVRRGEGGEFLAADEADARG